MDNGEEPKSWPVVILFIVLVFLVLASDYGIQKKTRAAEKTHFPEPKR